MNAVVVITIFIVAVLAIVVGLPWLLSRSQDQWVADPDAETKRLARCALWCVRFKRITLLCAALGVSLLLVGVVLASPPTVIFGVIVLLVTPFTALGWFSTRFPYARDRSGFYRSWDDSIRANPQIKYPPWARALGRWVPGLFLFIILAVKGYELLVAMK